MHRWSSGHGPWELPSGRSPWHSRAVPGGVVRFSPPCHCRSTGAQPGGGLRTAGWRSVGSVLPCYLRGWGVACLAADHPCSGSRRRRRRDDRGVESDEGLLSLRHLRLYATGRRAGSLIASLGFAAPGLATLAFLGAEPLSVGWWLAHFTDGLGVLSAAGGLLLAHHRDRSLASCSHRC